VDVVCGPLVSASHCLISASACLQALKKREMKEAHENYDGVKFRSVAIAIPKSCTCWLLAVE
jgi:hypothetical protein